MSESATEKGDPQIKTPISYAESFAEGIQEKKRDANYPATGDDIHPIFGMLKGLNHSNQS